MINDVTDKQFRSFSANLKDDTQIVIREAVIQDAADFIRCVKSYLSDGEHMVMEPEEFAPDTSQGREFIYSLVDSENSILLVATHNDRIIGNLDITGGKRNRLRHTGLVGMGAIKEYRDKGLGTLLLQAGIDWATKNSLLEKLWLQVLSDNLPAVSLYKKHGFIEEGRQQRFIRLNEHAYCDNILMSLMLPSVF